MLNKPSWIKDIKVLVWDLDGTLYKEIPEMRKGIVADCIKLVAEARKISFIKAKSLFLKTHENLKSSTMSLIKLGVDEEEVRKGHWFYVAQLHYLKKDKKTIKLFHQLRNYRHILHTNSPRKVTFKKLKKLGLDKNIFEKIFTTDEMGKKIKPHPAAFQLILNYTKLKPNQHLLTGDNEGKDIVPAQKLGFHTCLAWGRSKDADLVLAQVYDLGKLFSEKPF